jgi:hypothetical protein
MELEEWQFLQDMETIEDDDLLCLAILCGEMEMFDDELYDD